MFGKIMLIAVALLLASPSDDASAATKKKKKTIENSQSYTRGTSTMMRSNSYRGRVTQGRLPTPRATARGSAAASAPAVGGSASAYTSAPGGSSAVSAPPPGGSIGGSISARSNQIPSGTTLGPPAAHSPAGQLRD